MSTASDSLENVRRQYDSLPYPNVPYEHTHRYDPNTLYVHSAQTAFYLRDRKIVDPGELVLLDAGCGSGWKAQALVEANPGARVVGVDVSPQSVEVSRERLAHHGYKNAEFHTMEIARLPELGLLFDYINCDEVLYLVPEPLATLRELKAVLKPDGILRANLHNAMGRLAFLRAQECFKIMGLWERTAGQAEVDQILEMMEAMGENVYLKSGTWMPYEHRHEIYEWYMMNYLLQGDKGFSVGEMFQMLAETGFEFFCMTNRADWELPTLFQAGKPLPALILQTLETASIEQKLKLYELIHGNHRLMDFWCVHAGTLQPKPPLFSDWTDADFKVASIRMHPQLLLSELKTHLLESVEKGEPFNLNLYMNHPCRSSSVMFQPEVAPALLPLFDGPQPLMPFIGNWLSHLKNVEPTEPQPGGPMKAIINSISGCEQYGYFMVERG